MQIARCGCNLCPLKKTQATGKVMDTHCLKGVETWWNKYLSNKHSLKNIPNEVQLVNMVLLTPADAVTKQGLHKSK